MSPLASSPTSRLYNKTTLTFFFSEAIGEQRSAARAIFRSLHDDIVGLGLEVTVLSVSLTDNTCTIVYSAKHKHPHKKIAELAQLAASLVLKEVIREGEFSMRQWLKRSHTSSGVPLYITNPKILKEVVRMIAPIKLERTSQNSR